MASSALAIPSTYHQSTLAVKNNKFETKDIRSEDELLKFFLHGSYDVQRGHVSPAQIEAKTDQINGTPTETTTISDEQKLKSRCMFEETYMINISVKQPDAKPLSQQIDVRIEKASQDQQSPNKKIDDDEISSIFDEDDNDGVDSVIFDRINSTSSEVPTTKLTLADMINKTLTTIPALSMDNLNKITSNNNTWYIEQTNTIKTRKTSEDVLTTKSVEKLMKTSSPPTSTIHQAILTTDIKEDEKLFEYLDYLDTKEESNLQPRNTKAAVAAAAAISKIPSKLTQQEPIPIIDLEQLCRSLTVNDLKDELIRKKIFELKLLIDEQHKKPKSQIPLAKLRKDNIPVLIAMPPVINQRRRTTHNHSNTTTIPTKTGSLQASYNTQYQEITSNYSIKQTPSQYTQRQIPPTTSTRKYHYT